MLEERVGLENYHINDLRDTFASCLVMEGVPLLQASKLLRHASIQMTERNDLIGKISKKVTGYPTTTFSI